MLARAPASAANLGPGFDVLALAVDRYIQVEVTAASRLVVRTTGEGAGLSDDASHLAVRVAMDVAGTDRLAVEVRSQVPVARGLGSSAALAAAAAAAAGARDPLAVAARADGHPENAAASCVGGLVAATRVRGAVVAVPLPLDPLVAIVAMVPERVLSTAKARQLLPAQVPREHATFNLGRMALLLAGLADHRKLIGVATEDRLHQDFRIPLYPEAPQLLTALSAGGALAACWSGAGPTLIGLCTADVAPGLRAVAERAMAEAGVPGQVLVLHPDRGGLVTGDAAELPGEHGLGGGGSSAGAGSAGGTGGVSGGAGAGGAGLAGDAETGGELGGTGAAGEPIGPTGEGRPGAVVGDAGLGEDVGVREDVGGDMTRLAGAGPGGVAAPVPEPAGPEAAPPRPGPTAPYDFEQDD